VSGKLRASATLPPANSPKYRSLFVLKELTLSSNERSKLCRITCYTKTVKLIVEHIYSVFTLVLLMWKRLLRSQRDNFKWYI